MQTQDHATDILIVGGGLGGVAGALAALRLGRRVTLTEESPWLGGQLTSQAVPPDEGRWIEELGCTASYRALRNGVRDHYRRYYPLTPEARATLQLNPGAGNVSRLCAEPRAFLAVIEGLLAPWRSGGQLTVLMNTQPVEVHTDGDRVRAVTLERGGERLTVTAPYILDATEGGDLLPLGGVEHVVGAEGQRETGEPHALSEADPLNQQAHSWCFAVDYTEGADFTIPRPEGYDFWREERPAFWPDKQLSWSYPHPITHAPVRRDLFSQPPRGADLWHYRRILARHQLTPGAILSDITLVNWPQMDYLLGPLFGVSDAERERHLRGSRELSLSLLYWMQTEAPRHDNKGCGYPGLRLRPDVTGHGPDGLAQRVYLRESRRIRAEFTVTEQHVGVEARGSLQGAEVFPDTVGIGQYRIDLHPSTRGRNYLDVASWPFQIPLGALIPQRVENLLAAAKNIGVTHITTGCYRLHPVEWTVGEAAGALAAHCLARGLSPRALRNSPAERLDFQRVLTGSLGFELAWPEAQRLTPSPGF